MRRLLIRPGAIGDCLCWLPALAALSAEYVEVWAPAPVLSLIELAHCSRSFASSGFALLGIESVKPPPGLVEQLVGFDQILSWTGWNQPELQAACKRLNLPVTFFPALPDPYGSEHVSDFFLRQTSAWHGLTEEPPSWRAAGGRRFLLPFLPPMPSDLEGGNDVRRRPLVVLHPYSGSAAKNWPIERFRKVAVALAATADVRWCASQEDPLPAELVPGAWRYQSLRELALALAGASLFVGNDSGITHLAAMIGVPCVAIFGPMNPVVWAPRGSLLQIVRTPEVGLPASMVASAEVELVVLGLLKEIEKKSFRNPANYL